MTPPVFAHGHLRLYLLSLLAASAQGMHGYELIQALSDRFGGTYAPSAGTIYPRLAKLEEEGLIAKASGDQRRNVYTITDAGRRELAEREDELARVETDLTDSVRRLADEVRTSVNDAMRTLRAELAAAKEEARVDARESGWVHQVDDTSGRARSRANLALAEAAITQFRAEVRSELRSFAARGELSDSTVEALSSGLAELRRTVRATLR